MKRFVLFFVSALLMACAQPQVAKPQPPIQVQYAIDDREAYARILRSIVAVDLNVELKDVDAGVVKTEWHKFTMERVGCMGMFVQLRHVRYIVVASHGQCEIKGESETSIADQRAASSPWQVENGLTPDEGALLRKLADRIQSDLAAK